MFAKVQINEHKPMKICKASAALKNGAPVAYAPATETVSAATGADPMYVVISAQKFEGMNAILEPNDAQFEDIAANDLCIRMPLERGDIIATTEVTTSSLSVGDKLTATSGKFAKASSGGNCVYLGAYENPWGLNMYRIEVL